MGTGQQLTPSGGWRRDLKLMAATSTRVVLPSRLPCPSSSPSSPAPQLSSLDLFLLNKYSCLELQELPREVKENYTEHAILTMHLNLLEEENKEEEEGNSGRQ